MGFFMKLEEVIKGIDITKHYLDISQGEYKLFRCGTPIEKNQNVFAVRYEDGEAVDFVHMWVSHNKEKKLESKQEEKQEEKQEQESIALKPLPKRLGKGAFGTVNKKTQHKVTKSISGNTKMTEIALSHKRNQMLLEQKFRLHGKNIDQYFIIGLFRNKSGLDEMLANIYIMPKVEELEIDKDVKNPVTEKHIHEFTCALKTLNDMGLAVPDYCGDGADIEETGFQNDYYTAEGVRVFDLDSGFVEINAQDKKGVAVFRDQWLLVHNYKMNMDNLEKWIDAIKEWYKATDHDALSDNPEELLRMHAAKLIQLPEKIISELNETKHYEGRASLDRDDDIIIQPSEAKSHPSEEIIKPTVQVKASTSSASFWWNFGLLSCCSRDSALPDYDPELQQSNKKRC